MYQSFQNLSTFHFFHSNWSNVQTVLIKKRKKEKWKPEANETKRKPKSIFKSHSNLRFDKLKNLFLTWKVSKLGEKKIFMINKAIKNAWRLLGPIFFWRLASFIIYFLKWNNSALLILLTKTFNIFGVMNIFRFEKI